MHSKKITHRDLKLENILISDDDKIKIIDLGLSDEMSAFYNYKGTYINCTPELFNDPAR